MGSFHPKTKLQKLSRLAKTILKRHLLDCLIKQNIRCIAFKYFFRATYYCSIIAMIPRRRKVIPNISSIMAIIKFPEWFTVEINVNFLCSTMLLSKMTEMDILAKHLTMLMPLVMVHWKLTNRFSWIMRNCPTLEKPCSIMTGCRDEQ